MSNEQPIRRSDTSLTSKKAFGLSIWPICLVLLIAFAFRVYNLGLPEPTGDEGFSYVFVKNSIPEMLTKTIEMVEPHPIGSYVIQKAWLSLTGINEFLTRFPTVFFGVLLIALIYRFAIQLGLHRINRFVPLIAAGLMAVNAFAVHYSREMRMYSMHMALTLASTMLMVALVQRPRWQVVVAYVAVSWVALQVHYYAGFVLIAQNVFVLGYVVFSGLGTHRRTLGHWVAAQVALALTSAPWLIYAWNVIFAYRGNDRKGAPLPDVIADLIGNYTIGHGYESLFWLAAVIGGALFVFGLWRMWRAGRRYRAAVTLLLLYFAVPLFIGWFASQNRNIYSARYLISTMTPLLVPIAVAISALIPSGERTGQMLSRVGKGALAAATVALAVGTVMALQWDFSYSVNDKPQVWQNFLRIIDRYSGGFSAAQLRPVINYPNPVFSFYYDRRGEYATLPYQAGDYDGAARVVREMKDAGVKRIIFQVFPTWWDDKNIAESAISTEYTKIDEAWTGQFLAKVFARADESELKPVDITFTNGLELASAQVLADPKAELVEVNLKWNTSGAKLDGKEKMFIHVTRADNPFDAPAQLDLPLTIADDPARPVNTFGVRLPKGLPPKTYMIRVGVYDPSQPGAPRLMTNLGKDAAEIATFTVP